MHPLLRFTLDLFESNPPLAQVDKGQVAIKKVADFAHPQATREVLLGHTRVAYAFNRGQRRSIGFSVGVDGLAVRAPKWVTLRDVDAALQAKSDWILRKLQESRERHARLADQVIVWQDGATLPFLGQTLTLRLDPEHRFGAAGAQLLTEVPVVTNGAQQQGAAQQQLYVSLPRHATPEQIRDVVQAWLMRQAKRIFQERLDHFAPLLGVQWKKLSLSNAGTRWGSARIDGSIRLNWRLVHFKMSVLDYVVAHELSHLRVMDHSPRFWDTVRAVVPDFAEQRAQLKSEAVPRWG
ncbi:SprT family zinc-dependent metalloprotease [Rhodoferax sp.]|uniref:M48 family metallopeptidase n=1 Tax=Rhodoferax sp. TaxID=50421 RepID=UPI00283B8491|nr:SprT family zinc-dependent metalloprotease [Rhodoferax sp.]MDR3372075.1 SprT family zinc-dependent metalloprotease [Rhodoferax sp.]